jgi:signal transduction histidine kinase
MRLLFPKSASLALRLAWVFSLSIAIVAGLYIAVQTLLAHRFADHITQQSLMGQTHDIADAIKTDGQGHVTVQLGGADGELFDAFFANLKYRVLSGSGQVLASSDQDLRSLLPDVPPAQQDGYYMRTTLSGMPFQVAAVLHQVEGRDFLIQVGRSDRFSQLAQEAIVPAMTEAVGIMAVLCIVVLAILTYMGLRSVLQPIRRVSQAAHAVSQHNLSTRLPVEPLPSEVRPLVNAFNEVLDRLELAFGAQQRFFANAAHELKTPIALLRGQMEALGDRVSPETLGDIDALGRTVNQLLHIAEVAGGRPLDKKSIDLSEMTGQVIKFLSWRAEKAEVSLLMMEQSAGARIDADAGELFVLLKNLIENAVEHSPRGGTVRICLGAESLSVEDEGAGIAEHLRTRIFERFWRAPDNTKPGSGLGLAICMEVAKAHGWELTCTFSELGGALFRVQFARS